MATPTGEPRARAILQNFAQPTAHVCASVAWSERARSPAGRRSSPWTNAYDPPIDHGVLPRAELRTMESSANDIFASYLSNYYEGGASSVYFWDLDDTSFAACILFKKDVEQKKKGESAPPPLSHAEIHLRESNVVPKPCLRISLTRGWCDTGLESGGWDAIHVVEVRPGSGKRAAYKLTSTIMLRMSTDTSTGPKSSGEMKLSGSMTRQHESELSANDDAAHIANMGRLVEEMENRMRDSLQVALAKCGVVARSAAAAPRCCTPLALPGGRHARRGLRVRLPTHSAAARARACAAGRLLWQD